MDPMTLAIAGAGAFMDFMKSQQARKDAQQSQAYQRENLARTLAQLQEGKAAEMRMAGALRQDQFGNATYYDPNQGRWVTQYTPTQQRLIDEGQARQSRANIRGAQASEDYDRLRAEYLYNRPPTEAQNREDILRLLTQSRGTEQNQLNKLYSMVAARTAGNVPQIIQNLTKATPSMQLADDMLKARETALGETGQREQMHQSRYLPAMKQFESTANFIEPIDPTGQSIVGMTQQGMQDMLKYGSDYDKLLATAAISGGKNVLGASNTLAGQTDKTGGDLMNIAKMLQTGNKGKAADATTGTGGARTSTSGNGVDYTYRFGDDPLDDEWYAGTSGVPDYGGMGGFGAGNAVSYSTDTNPFGNIWQF